MADDFVSCGHVCIYFVEGELHFDLEQIADATVEQLAADTASAVHESIIRFYQEVSNAQSAGCNEQSVH